MRSAELLCKNLSLIGPPGSGKGSYGRHLAQWMGFPLLTVSDILRQMKHNLPNGLNLSSGRLVDDAVVSDAIAKHLMTKFNYKDETQADIGGYILDGFPRTMKQINYMQDTWPKMIQIQAAIWLDVPDHVCETKLLGRRICTKCDGNYNCNAVLWKEWDLPASLPDPQQPCQQKLQQQHQHQQMRPGGDSNDGSTSSYICNPEIDWQIRDDDQPDVIQKRLKVYHYHMDPILDHFGRQDRLFRFVPYKGYDDVPRFQTTLESWLKQRSY